MRLKWFCAALCFSLGLALALGACSDSVESPGELTSETSTHIIRDVDFIKGKYFFFDHPLVFVGPDDALSIDVYWEVLPPDIAADPTINRQQGIGLVDRDGFGTDINHFMSRVADLLEVNDGLTLDEAIDSVSHDGDYSSWVPVRNSSYRPLEATVDYQFITAWNDDVIGIELVESMNVQSGNRSLAVRYTNVVQAGQMFPRPFGVGGSIEDWGIAYNPNIGEQNRLVLEILFAGTASRPGADFGFTWSYMMRHVYDLGFDNIDPAAFSLDIEDIFDLRLDRTRPIGSDEPYIRVFGLDQTDDAGTGPPDGRIDLSTGIVDLEEGLLRMPFWTVRVSAPDPWYATTVDTMGLVANAGFWPDTTYVREWTDSSFQFDGEYEEQWENARRIYAERLTTQDEQLVNQYNIHAHWTRTTTKY